MKNKYSFAREINNARLKKENILLPVQDDNTPDWRLMRSYINDLSKKIIYNKKKRDTRIFKKQIDLNVKKWKTFKIKDVFNLEKGERLIVANRGQGDMPFLTASSINNGVSSFIDYEVFKDKKKVFENKITVDMFCNVFYQDFKYFSDDNIHTLLFKDKENDQFYKNKYANCD